MIGWNRRLLHVRFYLPGEELRSVYGDRKIPSNQRWKTTFAFRLLPTSDFLQSHSLNKPILKCVWMKPTQENPSNTKSSWIHTMEISGSRPGFLFIYFILGDVFKATKMYCFCKLYCF